jgi:3',5'-cyclic AMP phosphodiesterase CpdA
MGDTISPSRASAFRFAFLTDLHLMPKGDLRSAVGIATCLDAVEELRPRPDFILVGGDLVHRARDMAISDAEAGFDLFFKVWNDHTFLPAHWTFGNHDLAGTSNPSVSSTDANYGKGLFKKRLHLHNLDYAFEHRGWRLIILDDIAPQPDRGYIGQLFEDELAFAAADLQAHAPTPTIICTHIPLISNLPLALQLFQHTGPSPDIPQNLVCANSGDLTSHFPGHNVRAVLCGHLHHYEKLGINNIPFINSGAVCGSYWKGAMHGCPEGFGVVDVGSNGSLTFDYRAYGWKA